MRKDVLAEVSCVESPGAREIANAFASKASGAAYCDKVDHGFDQLVRQQEAAEDCSRNSHRKAAVMRSDLGMGLLYDGCTVLVACPLVQHEL